MTRVLIVEDHELLADTLSVVLEAEGYDVVRPPGLGREEVIDVARQVEPEVALLDLRLGHDRTALDMIGPLRDAGASVLMVTSERDSVAFAQCVEAGAIGIVHKSAPLKELVEAVHDVARLRTRLTREERDELLRLLREHREADHERLAPFEQLTPRERQVLAGLMEGLSADAIAQRDFVSITTTRTQIRSILMKLGVNSQLAAVALAKTAGWTPERA